ncbi:MAG TPA: hypothetical protein VM182_06915 [Terriglobia bacterium]|nr:hypothetical protein [Terriglobia bacterium]
MAKPAQLVCQHLENISRDALGKYQKIIHRYVFRRQGVYALYRRGRLYYVGLAGDLRWRLNAHLKDRHGQSWDRFSVYLTIGERHLRELESLLLRIIKPSPLGNRKSGKFKRSENLLRRFARDIKELQRTELDEIVGRELNEDKLAEAHRGSARASRLAEYIRSPIMLRARTKGKTLQARVRRDGSIRFAGKLYRTPSGAARAAAKYSVDGWWFWKFERAPGDWVRLDELRK